MPLTAGSGPDILIWNGFASGSRGVVGKGFRARRTGGPGRDCLLSRRRGPWGQERSARRRSRGRTVLARRGGGCYRASPRGVGVNGRRCAKRAGTKWIGSPPLSCARIGTAVCSCAGGGPILRSPMAVARRRCENNHGNRYLRRRWSTRFATWAGSVLEPIGEEVPGNPLSGGHLGPEETG
jgi:hypothetical protein